VLTYAERALDALGDATRRAVFMRLRAGSRSVGEIAAGLDVTRPAVSQHLKILKNARLVIDRQEGTRRIYSVDARGMADLRKWFDAFWDDALDAFKRAAESEARAERKRG
jgi:DNA-binding transcriptional ArsR family regulator